VALLLLFGDANLLLAHHGVDLQANFANKTQPNSWNTIKSSLSPG
jgi:hypothetical protein